MEAAENSSIIMPSFQEVLEEQNNSVVGNENESFVAKGKGYSSPYVGDLEIIIDKPCEEMDSLEETMFDHNVIPPFEVCLVSFSKSSGFDDGSFLTYDRKSENLYENDSSHETHNLTE